MRSELSFSEKKQDPLERAPRHSQQLEVLGQLSAGIAHEMNTPIQYIGDNLQFLQTEFAKILDSISKVAKKDPKLREILNEIDFKYLKNEIPLALSQSLEGVDHVSAIIRSMKDFVHPGQESQVQADLNHCIEGVTRLSKNEWKSWCDVNLDLSSDLPKIWCFPGLINQALFNLFSNSLDAVKDRIEKDEIYRGEILIKTRLLDDCIRLSVSDNGGGIPEKHLHQIFQPFFTTKAPGEGTGQGLALVRSLIEDKHRGTIEAKNTAAGALFEITLPIEGVGLEEVS